MLTGWSFGCRRGGVKRARQRNPLRFHSRFSLKTKPSRNLKSQAEPSRRWPMTYPSDMEKKYCFYCEAIVTERTGRGDHFPIPKRHDGKQCVPCCISCHDAKDRFNVGDWNQEWMTKVIADFPLLSRESRIFLAKAMAAMMDSSKILKSKGFI
jgi:hypothetical protein